MQIAFNCWASVWSLGTMAIGESNSMFDTLSKDFLSSGWESAVHNGPAVAVKYK